MEEPKARPRQLLHLSCNLATYSVCWFLPMPTLLLPLQVFDILPLYGMLQPNETQQMSFTFYGHAYVAARVKALCEVEGGPTYEILLSGEASMVNYAFDIKEVDYGLQVGQAGCLTFSVVPFQAITTLFIPRSATCCFDLKKKEKAAGKGHELFARHACSFRAF